MAVSDWSPIAAENTSITNNADLSTNISEQNPRAYTHNQAIQALMEAVAGLDIDETHTGLMNWAGAWTQKPYRRNDVVLDNGWTMISTVDGNEERAGIFATGIPFYIYEGTSPTTQDTAKQVTFGNRYTIANTDAGYLVGWRIYAVIGNTYTIFSVSDPLGEARVNQVISFTADATGWREFTLSPQLLGEGVVWDMVAIVQEPDPSPTVFSSDWNYQKPQNPAVPLSGQIIHSGREPGIMSIHTLDSGGVDRSAVLKALSVGDIIELAGGTRWAIQLTSDQGTYVDFSVSPALQDPGLGVFTFNFETTTPTPVTYLSDPAYWPTTGYTVQGLLGVDVPYENIVPDTNAYGIDILMQTAAIPTQWEVVAPAGSVIS